MFTNHVLAHKIFMSMKHDHQSKHQLKIKGVSHNHSSLQLSPQLSLLPTIQTFSGPPFLLLSHPSIGCLLLSSVSKVSDRLICIWCIQDRLPWEKSIQTSQLSSDVTRWFLYRPRSGYWAARRINLLSVFCSHCSDWFVDSSPA